MSKGSCEATGKRQCRLCEWRGRNGYIYEIWSSYDKIRYTYKQEVARSIIYYEDIDSATFFVNSATHQNENQFIKELAQRAKEEINVLSGKDRLIAICLFIKQMTLQETADHLGISVTAVFKRKKKIQLNLQKILRND